jgi:hypothetical protein
MQLVAGEALLKMISDIRHGTILTDFPTMNKEVNHVSTKYKKLTENAKRELHVMKYPELF